MNAAFRKFYSLPGVWQLFTVPVMTAVFTTAELRNSAAQSSGGRARYLLFWLVGLIECAGLIAWYVTRYSGYAASYELATGATFGVAGLVFLAWSCVYAWRRKPAFRDFLVKAGFDAARVGLSAASL